MVSHVTGPQGDRKAYQWGHSIHKNTYYHYDNYLRFSTQGDDTPDFWGKKRRGELLPINTFIQEKDELIRHSGGYSLEDTSGNVYWGEHTTMFLSDRVDHLFVSDLRIQGMLDNINPDALTQGALAKLGSATHDTLTFIAEFNKTVKLLKGSIKRLGKLLTSSDPKDWATLWLEGRYGWRLLYYDMRDISEALTQLDRADRKYHKDRIGYKETISTSHTTWGPFADGLWSGQFNLESNGVLSVRGTALAAFTPPVFGFNPITTTWELIPWSFVVDWFVSVGTALSALSTRLQTAEITTGYGYHLVLRNNGRMVAAASHKGHVTEVSYSEQERTFRKAHEPSFIPQVSVNLDAAKVTDLLAIILTRLKL